MHKGKPDACGKDCKRARGDADNIHEESVLRMLIVKKKIILDMQGCLARPGDDFGV